jgi:hypothetical protein
VTENGASKVSSGHLNQRIVAGTDGASFYLYHPEDLQHRLTSPLAWPCYHFACRPEFEAGRLVAFDTGADGGYAFRITDGPLTDREKEWLAGSWEFRYTVRRGRVYLDGGYALPSDNYCDESERHPDRWISLPNGNYRVRVNAIEWYSEPGAVNEEGQATDDALPSYVIQFTPIDELESIDVCSTPPRLETSRDWLVAPSPSFADYDTFDGVQVELSDAYVVLVSTSQAPIPGFHITLELSDEFYEAVYGSRGSTILPNRIEQLVIAASGKPPCVGAVVEPSGAGKSGGGPWSMSFHAKRLVRVTSLTPDKFWLTGKVEALDRPHSTVSPDRLDALKLAFADYAKSNEAYRQCIRNPDFEAERVASMNSAPGLTHVLIHHVQMPFSARLELLPLSDAARVERLQTILQDGE